MGLKNIEFDSLCEYINRGEYTQMLTFIKIIAKIILNNILSKLIFQTFYIIVLHPTFFYLFYFYLTFIS